MSSQGHARIKPFSEWRMKKRSMRISTPSAATLLRIGEYNPRRGGITASSYSVSFSPKLRKNGARAGNSSTLTFHRFTISRLRVTQGTNKHCLIDCRRYKKVFITIAIAKGMPRSSSTLTRDTHPCATLEGLC